MNALPNETKALLDRLRESVDALLPFQEYRESYQREHDAPQPIGRLSRTSTPSYPSR